MEPTAASDGDAIAATQHRIRRTEGAKERQAPLWLTKPPGLDVRDTGGMSSPAERSSQSTQIRRSPSRARDREPSKSLPSSVTSSPARPQRARRRQDRSVQSAEPSEAGSGGAPTGTSSRSTGSGEQRHSRRPQQPRPGSAPAIEPRPADPPLQPEGSGVMLRAAVQAASNSRPHSAAHSQTASAPGSRHASPSKSAPKTLAAGQRRTPARRPASAAPDTTGQQLQEERERAERAEDQLDQLTRSLAQEKSTSSALQAERAALERLQAELAERCSLLELKARMLEQSAGQPQYAEEGLAAEEGDFQYADDVHYPGGSVLDHGLQHEDDTPILEASQQ